MAHPQSTVLMELKIVVRVKSVDMKYVHNTLGKEKKFSSYNMLPFL